MNNWIISYRNFNAESQRLKETVFTLGNGYFATRGADEDGISSIHYPGTYLAGTYNRLSSTILDKKLINEDLVKLPNWLAINFKIEDQWFDLNKVKILSYRSLLNLKKGLTRRSLKFKDQKGRIFILNSLRFINQSNPHLAGLSYSISSTNWEGELTIRSSIIADVYNEGVPRYKDLNSEHLDILEKEAFNSNCLLVKVRTKSSRIEIAEAIKTEFFSKGKIFPVQSIVKKEKKNIHQEFSLTLKKHEKIRINKTLSLYTSKDKAVFETSYEAKKAIKSQLTFSELLKKHVATWNFLWQIADIKMEAQDEMQKLIRLHLYHSLQTLSKHSIPIDCGIPARGLHGEAYRGHVFWDEIFILPFFNFHFPEIARAMLMYRYHRLESARDLAKKNGYKGAMFPWQSGSNGEEETQKYHLNPKSSLWGPDNSCYQRHVNLSIVYNIWAYYEATQDFNFLNEYGAEMIFEIAKFISSLTSFNKKKNRYEIKAVMGPDEYHETYPHSSFPGINNNAYTNIMSVWVLEKALQLTELLSARKRHYFFETLEIKEEELKRWKDITLRMFVPLNKRIISQFEGYEKLKEFNWELYQKKHGKIERLDRILKAENKNPNEYKIAKQPDVLMLFYLLEDQEIERILKQLNYQYNLSIKANTIAYYLKRTSHGSTLSKITFATLLSLIDPETSKQLFHESLISDIQDTQGGTTEEGIHLGVMVATIQYIFKNISGIKILNNQLSLNPILPSWIHRLSFKFIFNQNFYRIEVQNNAFHLTLLEKNNENTTLIFKNEAIKLDLGKTIILNCSRNQEIEKTLKESELMDLIKKNQSKRTPSKIKLQL